MWVLVFTPSSVPGLIWVWQHMPGLGVILALSEVEAGKVRDRHPQRPSEFWSSLSYIRPCLKEINRIKQTKITCVMIFGVRMSRHPVVIQAGANMCLCVMFLQRQSES